MQKTATDLINENISIKSRKRLIIKELVDHVVSAHTINSELVTSSSKAILVEQD